MADPTFKTRANTDEKYRGWFYVFPDRLELDVRKQKFLTADQKRASTVISDVRTVNVTSSGLWSRVQIVAIDGSEMSFRIGRSVEPQLKGAIALAQANAKLESQRTPQAANEIAEALKVLVSLLEEGVIDQAEFQSKRRDLLARM